MVTADAAHAKGEAKADPHAAPTGVPADEALRMRADGNARFVAGAPSRSHQNVARLCDTFANGQHPFAAVLACADSRVPVELVFDAGIGDLFVVRVAGNVGDVDETGTLEYGVEHLGINAIVVIGHTKCGAVTAVVEKANVTKNIEQLVDNIGPAAEQARKTFPQLTGPRLVDKAIRANVNCAMADLLKNSELLRDRVASGKLKVVGGVYDLHSGEVDWLEPGATSPIASGAHASAAAPVRSSSHGADHGNTKHDARAATAHRDAHDEHGDGHRAPTTAPSAAGVTKDNLPLLGGMLAVGGVASYAITHVLGRMKGSKATAPTAATTEAAPAAG